MAQIDNNRYQLESAFMTGYWPLRKALATPEDTPEYWNQVYEMLTKFGEQFKNDYYAECILLACVSDLEYRSKHYSRGDMSTKVLNLFRTSRGLLPVKEQE